MRLSGCLDKKIKVIGLLENFLDDFEKKKLEIFEFSKKIEKNFFQKKTNFFSKKNFSIFFENSKISNFFFQNRLKKF